MKQKYFLFLCLSFLIFNSSLLIGTVRYVSKTGNSTPPYTTWETAADSIQKCINICIDGDTVYVANGVYKENLVINTQIFLSGLSMDSTIIDGRGMGNRTIRFNAVGSLENFNIYGIGLNTLQTDAITAFKYIEIKYCRVSEAAVGIGLINSANVNNNFITNCLYGCVSAPYDTSNIYLYNNLLTFNNENAIGIASSIYGYYYINNNVIIFTGDSFTNPGHGISIGAPRKVYINNNLVSGFTDNIFIDTVLDTAFIKNNLLMYQFSLSSGPASIYTGGNQVVVKNVVLSNNKNGLHGDELVTSDYNIYWKNTNNLVALGTIPTFGDSDLIADPMFVKDTIPRIGGIYDYHLQKYSPAIDAGDPNILDVDGSRSDIGIFGGPLGKKYTYQDLAPKPPRNLTASMDSGLVHLKWNKNTEADLFRYRVYRDTVPDFIYDTTKIIAVLSDTTFYDDPPQKFISGN